MHQLKIEINCFKKKSYVHIMLLLSVFSVLFGLSGFPSEAMGWPMMAALQLQKEDQYEECNYQNVPDGTCFKKSVFFSKLINYKYCMG